MVRQRNKARVPAKTFSTPQNLCPKCLYSGHAESPVIFRFIGASTDFRHRMKMIRAECLESKCKEVWLEKHPSVTQKKFDDFLKEFNASAYFWEQ